MEVDELERTRRRRGDELAEKKKVLASVEKLHESNPMLGLRGVRLGIHLPGPDPHAGAGDLRGRLHARRTASTSTPRS